ncbi:hypothetical protein D3C73_1291470 [compost metagenome]
MALADLDMAHFDQVALVLGANDLRHGNPRAFQCFHPLQLGAQRRFAVIAVAMDTQGHPLAVVAAGREHRVLAVFHQFDVAELTLPVLQGVASQIVQPGDLLIMVQGMEFSHGRGLKLRSGRGPGCRRTGPRARG